jgi:hypothetical protein
MTRFRAMSCCAARGFSGLGLRAEAERLTKDGARVTVFLFEATPRAHKVASSMADGGSNEGGFMVDPTEKSREFSFGAQVPRLSEELRRIAATRFANDPVVEFRNR